MNHNLDFFYVFCTESHFISLCFSLNVNIPVKRYLASRIELLHIIFFCRIRACVALYSHCKLVTFSSSGYALLSFGRMFWFLEYCAAFLFSMLISLE